MKSQIITLPNTITLNNLSVELGNTSIHSAYMLSVHIEATNNSGSAKTPTIAEFLSVLQTIAVVSDNTRYHYSLSGLDIARRNAMYTKNGLSTRVLDMTFASKATSATMSADFVLALEEGDIIALMHDSVTLKAVLGTQIAANCPVTNVTIRPTIYELVPSADAQTATAELLARYGQNFSGALEPKVYALQTTCPANTEITGFFNLPTGALLRSGMMHWSAVPDQFGIIATVPTRSELMRMSWDVARAKDERKFGVSMPANVVNFEFDSELTLNGLGLDGRAFNRGDYQLSARTNAQTTLRYVSFEMVFPAIQGGALNAGHVSF